MLRIPQSTIQGRIVGVVVSAWLLIAGVHGRTMEGSSLRGKRGQTLVELALLMPLMLWICAGTVDFGRVYYYDIAAISAARSGARMAADSSKDDAAVRAAVRADAGSSMTLTDADITITPTPTRTVGNDTTVSVTYRFTPITPLLSSVTGGTLTVTRSATMVVIY